MSVYEFNVVIMLQNTTGVIFGLTRDQSITITHIRSVRIPRNEHMLERTSICQHISHHSLHMLSALLFVFMSASDDCFCHLCSLV